MWKQEIKLCIVSSFENLIDTCIEYEGNIFYDSFIYADTDRPMQRLFWDHFVSINASREASWFIAGDFNDLTSNSKKVGGPERPESSFADLHTFFSVGDFYDLQQSGDCLSWEGKER